MESPKYLLKGLNRALLALLGAIEPLNDLELKQRLRDVVRKSVVAEVLADKWVIAIAGAQGAGKTTLLNALYRLDDDHSEVWLNPNEGRGERLPVLVLEDSACEMAQGLLRELQPQGDGYRLGEREVRPDEFREAISGENDKVVLPVLRVPSRYFERKGQAFMLLPGYETLDNNNSTWQKLMRQALVHSARCVIVTDSTRMAGEQQSMLKDMRASQLIDVHPLVVISQTEALRHQPERRGELAAIAAEMFGIPQEKIAGSVHCVGVNDKDYVKEWLPPLEMAFRSIGASGDGARKEQLARLADLLSTDLGEVLNAVEARTEVAASGDGTVVEGFLRAFDSAHAGLKTKYVAAVDALFAGHLEQARKRLGIELEASHEGFTNNVLTMFDTVSATHRKLDSTVDAAWQAGGPVRPAFLRCTQDLTQRTLGTLRIETRAEPRTQPGSALVERTPRLTHAPMRPNDDDLNNLRVLFRSDGDSENEPAHVSLRVANTIRLLPPMMLEALRVACLEPEVASNARPTETLPTADLDEPLQRVTTMTQSMLRGLALVMAIDVGVDGKVDSIPAFAAIFPSTGTAATTTATAAGASTAAAVASAVIGVAAVTYLAHAVLQEVRRYDGAVRVVAHRMLGAIADRHQAHFLKYFDEVMNTLREHLRQCLYTRYRLDESLARQDRLAKAIADAGSLRHTLLEQIGSSGATLPWFAGDSAR